MEEGGVGTLKKGVAATDCTTGPRHRSRVQVGVLDRRNWKDRKLKPQWNA